MKEGLAEGSKPHLPQTYIGGGPFAGCMFLL